MKIGVLGIKNGWSSKILVESLQKRGHSSSLLEMENITWDMAEDSLYHKSQNLKNHDAVIIKKLGREYSPSFLDRLEILEHCTSTRFFSPPSLIKSAVSRLSCTSRLRKAGLPIPPTTITESIDVALTTLSSYEKAVLKPLYTSKARGMILMKDTAHSRETLEKFKESNPVMYIQKLVDIPGKDLGIVFLGGRYLSTYSRVIQTGSWNTTIRSGGRYEPFQPPDHILNIAQKAQNLFNLDFTCVDIAETPDGPVVFEVSPFGGFRGLMEANSINAADLYSDYVINAIKS